MLRRGRLQVKQSHPRSDAVQRAKEFGDMLESNATEAEVVV
jgi:hypothetical protein